jgi:hypothetical protein
MKVRVKIMLIGMGIIIGYICGNAQVTIGSEINPVKGAILDLKNQEADPSTNVTATKGGLLLPRVKLESENTLQPFISTSNSDTKRDHIGLTVYNLTDNGTTFHEGIYLWTGVEWKTLDHANVVFLPTFRLDTVSGNRTINLFDDVYKTNFNPASLTNYVSSHPVAGTRIAFPGFDENAEDFYYVITNYDTAIYTIQSITNEGLMTYSLKPGVTNPPVDALVNAVMIRKKNIGN